MGVQGCPQGVQGGPEKRSGAVFATQLHPGFKWLKVPPFGARPRFQGGRRGKGEVKPPNTVQHAYVLIHICLFVYFYYIYRHTHVYRPPLPCFSRAFLRRAAETPRHPCSLRRHPAETPGPPGRTGHPSRGAHRTFCTHPCTHTYVFVYTRIFICTYI